VTFALAVLALAFALWSHRPRAVEPLRLYDMMRLRGVPEPRLEDDDVAAAERRCAACASKKMCDALLSAGDAKGYRQFCPNALYLEWLRSNSLNFD
jgi:hypothetical protein